MISLVSPSNITGLGYHFRSGNGRATVAVNPANYIYSHFKHVSGVPAPDGMHGATVSKLKILDTIIERLSQARRQKILSEDSEFDRAVPQSEAALDAKILALKTELEQSAAQSAPYTTAASIPGGSFFSILE